MLFRFGESFGIVLLEAMATGTPVIASDIEAFTRVLDNGRFGRLFANDNPGSLAVTVNALLADDAGRRDLAIAGRQRAQSFDWQKVASHIIDVYQSIIIPNKKVTSDVRRLVAGKWGSL